MSCGARVRVASGAVEDGRRPITCGRLSDGPIEHFAPPAGIKAPPLSFATRVGDLLFVSGIPGFDDKGALPDSFEAQFGFVVRNIRRVLDEAGTGP